MKKIITFLLVLVLVLSFAGCKEKGTSNKLHVPEENKIKRANSGSASDSDLEPISTDSGEIRDTDMAEENP